MVPKRKWDDFNDTDDDEPSFGKQILPVANLPEDFDGTPCDGMQYLFTVRRDARHLPHITRVENPYESNASSSQQDVRVIPSHITVPSVEWRILFENRFKNFRKNINQPTIYVHSNHQQYSKLMPDKKERDLWWAYLAGKPESDWNHPKKPKQSVNPNKRRKFGQGMRGFANDFDHDRPPQESWQTNDEGEVELVLRVDPSESLPTPTGSPAPDGRGDQQITSSSSVGLESSEGAIFKPREPSPSLLMYIDQKMALHLLMYFSHWINLYLAQPTTSTRPIETHAHWIFALLSRVEDHVSADDMNLLRNLARACIGLLKTSITARITMKTPTIRSDELVTPGLEAHSEGFMRERSCWIILSIIVGVWAQRDLWADAEDMLKALGT